MLKYSTFLLTIILFTFLSLQAQAQTPQWQQTNGPFGGSITSIVSANGYLFASTFGAGVFISTDNGSSWSARNVGLPYLKVNVLCVKGTNLFAGTFGGGIYMSSNSGMSWSAATKGLDAWYIDAFAVSNNNIFAGSTYGGVHLSTDNGTTWTNIYSIPKSSTNGVTALATNGTDLWTTTYRSGVYHLTNNGSTCAGDSVYLGEKNAYNTSVAVSNGNVYVGLLKYGVYVLQKNTTTWTQVVTGLSNLDVECLYVSGSTLYAGTNGGGVFTYDGATWSEQNSGLGSLNIKCITSDGQYLYAGTDGGGIYRWTDADGSWTRINSGLTGTIINAFMVTSPGRLYAATQGCGTFVTYDSGAVWNQSNNSSDENYVKALAFDGSYYYKGTSKGIFRLGSSAIWYNMGGSNNVSAFFVDGNNLFASGENGVILSTDHGANWTPANSGLGIHKVLSFAHIGSNIFAATLGHGVFLSTNNGNTWTDVNSNLPTYVGARYTQSLVSTGSNLFAALYASGVFLTTDNGTSWTALDSGLTNTSVNSLAISSNGTGGTKLFAGTDYGICVSTNNGTSWSSLGLTSFDIHALTVNGTNLYAGTHGCGVWRLSISQSTQDPQDPQNPYNPGWTVFDTSKGMPDPIVHSITVDAQDNGWIGTEGGLGKYDGNTWTNYTPYNSNFPGWTVYTSVIDGQGNKWFGTDSHGLVKFDGSNWTTYLTSNSGLPENTIYALAIDGQANKWVGTYYGLAKYDGTNWTVYNSFNSTPDMSGMGILSLAADGQGNKWIGTWAFGLVKFDGINWMTYDNSNSNIPSNYIYAITPDAQGNLWIGTHLGVGKFDGTNWTTYNESNSGLPNNKVHAIAIDTNGNKWIGTEGGLARFDGVNWTIYNNANSSLPGDFVYAVTIDSYGNKWIGTDKGLAIFNGNGEKEQNVLIAHYPLNSTPNDTTGNFGPMVLTNTPYQEGGIYCNGLDIDNSGGGCRAETPALPPSIFKSFIVTVNFKVTSYTSSSVGVRPVIMGGVSYRWVGVGLDDDSTVVLRYNGNFQRSQLHYSLNTWHEAKIIYDSSKALGELYLDGILACSASYTIEHGTTSVDKTFTATDWSMGRTFEGILRDLKIYSTSNKTTSVQNNPNVHPADIQLSQNYPNPFNPSTTIQYSIPQRANVSLKVYDLLGREVARLVDEVKVAGNYGVVFNGSKLTSGVYFYRLLARSISGGQADNYTETKKLILLK